MSNETRPYILSPIFLDEMNLMIERAVAKAISDWKPETQAETPTDISGAAEFVNLDQQTIYRLARTGGIPFYKKHRKLYFFKSELANWLKGYTSDAAVTKTRS